VIGVALAQVIPNYAAREEGIDAMVTSMSPLTAILIVALQPAVCEEFFCRGFLAASFRELKSEGAVIFLTSLIFGFLHMDLYAFLPAAILGAAFAFIALRTRSLLIPMILHFLNNAFSVVVAYVTVGSDANASSFADLSTATLLSYIAFYLGLAIFFLWFSLRWFLGKKLIVKSSLLPFILASAFVVVGYGGLLATSLDFVVNETQTVAYTEVIAQEIPVTLEEGGNYAMEVTAFADHPFRIVLKRGNEIVKSTTYDTAPSLSFSGSLEAGNYSVGFYSADGAEITEGRLTYVIMAVLSKL
jgi:membrane protease YdiL (CAAX protease family)